MDERQMIEELRRARLPTQADRARLRGAIDAAIVGGGVAAGATVHAAAATSRTALWVKLVALAAVIAAGVAVTVVVTSSRSEPSKVAPAVTQAAPVVVPPAQPPAVVPPPPAPPPPAEPPPPVVQVPHAKVKHAPPVVDLAAELELLHEAQLAWRGGNAARTLELVADHERRFPSSQLAAERGALRILALCAVGRTDDARRLATQWLRDTPHSPSRRSVEESCAGR